MEPESPEKKIENTPPKISPIRTFKSDIEEMVKRGASTATIVMAEQKKRIEHGVGTEEKQHLTPLYKISITASIIFLVLGTGLLVSYFIVPRQKETVTPITVSQVLHVESEKEIPIDGLSSKGLTDAILSVHNGPLVEASSIVGLSFTKKSFEERKTLSASEFLTLLGVTPQASFVRSLKKEFLFGFHGFSGNQPFLILKTDSFENAFAGMLEWEKRIPNELAGIFLQQESTSTTTPLHSALKGVTTTSVPPFIESSFKDTALLNKDSRVLRDENGKIILLYSFVTQDTLLITTNETTFAEIMKRLSTATLVR